MIANAARAYPVDQLMTISSDLLGPLEVEQDELFNFPQGLFGFPECRSFVLVSAERDGLYWLQSADYPSLTFLVLDPFPVFEGYAVDISNADQVELGVSDPADVSILAIVTLPGSRQEKPTANLQGPLALNTRTRAAKQIVLQESEYGTRCEFELGAPA